MKKLKAELKTKNAADLTTEINKTIDEITKMKFELMVSTSKNTNEVFQKKKHLARLKTELTLKQKTV